uniref:Uncharacterized protein n=1 Tax=Anopheles atroparvus TaxID=41427 RepID=A0AAG5DHP0_ANOAO
MHKRALVVHQIILLAHAGPRRRDGRRVGEHTDGPLGPGQLTARQHRGRLLVDADLEPGGTPVDEVDVPLGLDCCHRLVGVLGHDVTAEQHAAGHVLAHPGVALYHRVLGREARVRDLGHGAALVERLRGGHERRVRDERKVHPRKWHQVRLKLVQVHVHRALEAERGRGRRDDLRDQRIQVGVVGPIDLQRLGADLVRRLVVHDEAAVGRGHISVRAQHGVVRLDDGRRDLRRWVHRELQLALLPVVHRDLVEQQRGKAGPGASAERVEQQETLQPIALLRQLPQGARDALDDLLADGVVSAGEIVCRVLLPHDHVLRMVQLLVRAVSDVADNGLLQVDKNGPGYDAACARVPKEARHVFLHRQIRAHQSIGLHAVLGGEQLPACIPDLAAGLSNLDRNYFALRNTINP